VIFARVISAPGPKLTSTGNEHSKGFSGQFCGDRAKSIRATPAQPTAQNRFLSGGPFARFQSSHIATIELPRKHLLIQCPSMPLQQPFAVSVRAEQCHPPRALPKFG
jgi:hypothetical protein